MIRKPAGVSGRLPESLTIRSDPLYESATERVGSFERLGSGVFRFVRLPREVAECPVTKSNRTVANVTKDGVCS